MQHLEPPEGLVDGADYTRCSYAADQCATWCRSLAITVCSGSKSCSELKNSHPLGRVLIHAVPWILTCAVHHCDARMASGCSGDGWSSRAFVLLVSCCRSTLSCEWLASSKVGRGSTGCSCWRLVLTPVPWFLGGADCSRIKTCWVFSSPFLSLFSWCSETAAFYPCFSQWRSDSGLHEKKYPLLCRCKVTKWWSSAQSHGS